MRIFEDFERSFAIELFQECRFPRFLSDHESAQLLCFRSASIFSIEASQNFVKDMNKHMGSMTRMPDHDRSCRGSCVTGSNRIGASSFGNLTKNISCGRVAELK